MTAHTKEQGKEENSRLAIARLEACANGRRNSYAENGLSLSW